MRKITFKGSPLTLVGRTISVGKAAPDFKVVNGDLKEISLSDVKGKIKIITSFPSIDTPVCDMQVKEFNKPGFCNSKIRPKGRSMKIPSGFSLCLSGYPKEFVALFRAHSFRRKITSIANFGIREPRGLLLILLF